MSDFTQGTWSTDWVVNDDNGCVRIYAIDESERDPQPEPIADVWTCDCIRNLTDEGIANLRLILAAPEMYGLICVLLRCDVLSDNLPNSCGYPALTKARSIVNKVTGLNHDWHTQG